MSLRDCELDVALLLEAAGLGSTTSNPPTIYAGPFPASAPDAFLACRLASAEKPEKYLANVRLSRHQVTVTVQVRGTREPDAYMESGTRARAAWSALYDLHPSEYIRVDPEDGGPTYLGQDEEGRPRWSFSVGLEYLSASAPGVVVPLSRDASLHVAGLEVAGEARVGGALVLGALPFASFPTPAGHTGALLFDTDAGELRVSDGSTWHSVGTPTGLPAGPLEVTEVDEGADALTLPTGTRLRLGSNPSAYFFSAHPYDDTLETPGALKVRALLLQQGYVGGVGTGVTLMAGTILGPSVRLRSGLRVSEPASGRPASDGHLLQIENADGMGDYTAVWSVRHDGTTVQPLTDTTATPGSATANTPRGFATVPAGVASITLTSSCARPGCQVLAWVQQAAEDSAAPQLRTSVPAGGGAITIHCNPAPATPLRVAWRID